MRNNVKCLIGIFIFILNTHLFGACKIDGSGPSIAQFNHGVQLPICINNAATNLDLLLCEGDQTKITSPTEADPENSRRTSCVLINAHEEAPLVISRNTRQKKIRATRQISIRAYAIIPKKCIGVIPDIEMLPDVDEIPRVPPNRWIVPESKAVFTYSIDNKEVHVTGNIDCWHVSVSNEEHTLKFQYTCWVVG